MKQFFRNFNKQKIVGILNISSLSLGIMVSVIIGLWAINELSFDNFHKNGDRMYRVTQLFDLNKNRIKAATAFKPLGEIAKDQIPEIEEMCRVVVDNENLTINNKVNTDIRTIVTDHNFFSFFTFPLKEGDVRTSFAAPDNVIISESAVKKFFPDEDPIGKMIIMHGEKFYVSAIMYDMPLNSHIQAEVVFPLFGHFKSKEWDSGFYYDTYFLIPDNADFKSIEERLAQINRNGISSFLKGAYMEVKLEPLKEVHFSKTETGFDSAIKGNKSLLMTFLLVAIVILVIACINFTNLFISTSFIRAKTIGIKKSQGASKKSLILDFYKETSIYVFISVLMGLLLALFSLPVFNEYIGSQIKIDFTSPQLYLFLFGLIVLTILIAGTFPAIQMTRFGIIETLRGKFKGKRMSLFQKGLVIVQFTASICLLIIVSFFGKQIDHILSQDLGFNNENVIVVNGWMHFGADLKALRDEMTQDPSIEDVAMKQYDLPYNMGNGLGGKNIKTGEEIMLDLSEVSPNYFDFFGMEFVAGENPLTLESASASRYCVINERAAEALGLDNPIDAPFTILSIGGKLRENDGKSYIVKGVIRDSYVKSLYQSPDPQMYLNLSRQDHNPIFFKSVGNPQRAIEVIKKKWDAMNPIFPFKYSFLDEKYNMLYKSETNARKVLTFALIITLIITIAGLFAMAFYSTQRRIKEIGIRKVNGATSTDLLILLNKDFMIWVLISFIVACPISYVFVDNWLDNFSVRTSLNPLVFIIAGILSFVIALLTVSYQTWRAANMNPVNAIQNE